MIKRELERLAEEKSLDRKITKSRSRQRIDQAESKGNIVLKGSSLFKNVEKLRRILFNAGLQFKRLGVPLDLFHRSVRLFSKPYGINGSEDFLRDSAVGDLQSLHERILQNRLLVLTIDFVRLFYFSSGRQRCIWRLRKTNRM